MAHRHQFLSIAEQSTCNRRMTTVKRFCMHAGFDVMQDDSRDELVCRFIKRIHFSGLCVLLLFTSVNHSFCHYMSANFKEVC